MRCKTLVLALTAVSGIASAQPGPPPQPPPPPMDTTTTTTTPDPGPPENPQPPADPNPPQPPMQPQPTMAVEPGDESRPSGISIGLGLGFTQPIALDMPNISTLRLRLPSGLTFEPAVRISNTSSDQDTPAGEMSDKLTEFGLAALLRLPIVTHRKVDLEALAGAGFSNSKSNPEGDYNATTVNNFDLAYGVAVSYWLSRHWNFSMSITNPLIDYRQSKVQNGVPNMTTKSSETTIGIIFEPNVFMMIHLYN